MFNFNLGFGGWEGLIVVLFVQVKDPIISIAEIIKVIWGLNVLSKVSFIKK